MKIIIAIDSFKGCLSSMEANEAAKAGVLQALPSAEVITMPVSDGGEGWLDAVHHAIGGKYHMADAVDPLLRPIRVPYLFHRESRTAYVESAKVIGMGLLVERHRQCPSYLWSCGMADLLVKIWKAHPRCHIVVGLGGSATCDAGIGMMMYLEEDDRKWHFRDTPLPSFTIAYDVANPLCGPTGAARMFAPQKGATTHEVEILERRAAITAIRWKRMLPEVWDMPSCNGWTRTTCRVSICGSNSRTSPEKPKMPTLSSRGKEVPTVRRCLGKCHSAS